MRMMRIGICLLLAATAHAADLVQYLAPGSTSVSLTPGQTRALVREARQVALPAGESLLAFSWNSGKVDPGTVTLTVRGATVGETLRPAGQDKAFLWKVRVPAAAQAEATVSYLMDGFRWQPSYRLWLTPQGATARLEGLLQLTNDTGQDLRQAEMQIVPAVPGSLERAADDKTATVCRVPGACTLSPGETRIWPFLHVSDLPVSQEYRYDLERYKGAVQRIVTLDLAALRPLLGPTVPPGALQLFGAVEEATPLLTARLEAPPGKDLEVDLGPEPDVVVERKLVGWSRSNFERDRIGKVSGCDTLEEYELLLRNHLPGEVALRVTEMVLSTWELRSEKVPDKKDATTAQFLFSLPGDGNAKLKFALLKRSGTRAK